jgi:hypothetical protein
LALPVEPPLTRQKHLFSAAHAAAIGGRCGARRRFAASDADA